MSMYFIVEASHLFRAGEIHASQIYVIDVVKYLARNIFDEEIGDAWVLFGSTKDIQAEKYTQAVEKTGIKVVRMVPIDSRITPGSKFYKPSTYLQNIIESLPEGAHICLVGFHNNRFEDMLKVYKAKYRLSLCAFTTKSKSQNDMKIPEHFKAFLQVAIDLDEHIDGIKNEYKRSKQESE